MISNDNITIRKFDKKDQNDVIKHFIEGKMNREDEFSFETKALNEWFANMKLSLDMEDIYSYYMTESDITCKCFWVAVDSFTNEVVGFVGAIPCTYNRLQFSDPLAPNLETSKYLELVRMTVAKSAKRKGIGSKLIENLELFAKQMGFQGIYLTTLVGMYDAVSFYKRNGFKELYIEIQKTKDLPNFDYVDKFESFEVVHFIKDFI